MWSLDVAGSPNPDQQVKRKVEELAWAVTMIYGVTGWKERTPFEGDFGLCVSRLCKPYILAVEPLFLGCT
jgi:hypothetical protein